MVLFVRDQRTKNRFGHDSAPAGSFQDFFGSSEPRSLRNLLTLTTLGGSTQVFRQIRDLMGFGVLQEILRPRSGPKTGQNRQKVDFPGLGDRSGQNIRRPY